MSDVVIFGLGRIGARNVNLSKDVPLSHLAAVRMTPGLTLAGLIDPDPAARAAAAALFPETPPDIIVGDASELPLRSGEVVAICTPMQTHEAVLATALKRSPRVVIVEKPLAPNIGAARAMVDAAGAALRVNFHRRFDPRHRRWKERSPRKPHAIIGRYGKGFFNYGSHMIDLLVDWYG
ncbi:MAG: Gfo/Idh/MocA family oxidoreductase, partial [Rhodospirillaceae bacterium]|nr:Gfo/Idh/MocA family oxidoreductase [Rhodospirillaceae bacterium]